MNYYRKKPVIIEARQFTDGDGPQLAEWCRGRYGRYGTRVIEVDTLEGTHQAVVGDWIVKGVEGEFYNVKGSVFDKTYELVYGAAGWPEMSAYSQACREATLLGQDHSHHKCTDPACECTHHKRKDPA